jgi:hypothetical protein
MTYYAGRKINNQTNWRGGVNATGDEGSIDFGERGSVTPFFPLLIFS